MSQIIQMTNICTAAGHRTVTGIFDCQCTKFLLIIDAAGVDCGHCQERIHRWADGSLVGLVLTCVGGVLTIHLVDLEVDLHRCGEADTLAGAVDDALEHIFAGLAVPA